MTFPIADVELNPGVLAGIGFVVGVLGGFFGVGGSFLAGPALFGLGVPMNFVVGTDLAHIVGKSVVAARKHHALGHVDIKLGLLMIIGTIPGVELGARLIEYLKRMGNIDWIVGISFIVILVAVSAFMGWEGWQTLKSRPRTPKSAAGTMRKKDKPSVLAYVAKKVQRIGLPPYVKLKTSGVSRISLWTILVISFVGGVFSGFLGGGAGYIRLPSLIYLMGIPTHVAVGTDLFEVIISAGFGTVSHALKGNVDILIALVMHTGAAIGAQIGTVLTQYFDGVRLRLAFAPLPLVGAGVVLYGLLKGHPPN